MKILCSFLLLITNCFCEDNSQVKKNNFLQRSINPEIQKYWNLSGGMNGGILSPNLKKINFGYWSSLTPTKEEARKLYLEISEYILFVYNCDEKIRPFLDNYPYLPTNIGLTIFFPKNSSSSENIDAVSGFKDWVTYTFGNDQELKKIKIEYEKFDEAFQSVYGKKWDPFKYGESCDEVE